MPTDQKNTNQIFVGGKVDVPCEITAVAGVDGNDLTLRTIYPSTIGGTLGSTLTLNAKQVLST